MNCGEVNRLSPMWHTGELETARRVAFAAHVAGCVDCAEELREQLDENTRLRQSVFADAARESTIAMGLERRVMRRIARERMRRWLLPLAGAAAVAATIPLFIIPHRPPQNPAVFSDAARDHTLEVIQRAPRHWRADPVEIAALETSQGISQSEVRAIEATGYRLERAKVCRLGGTPFMHLVYAKGGREFSVYIAIERARLGRGEPIVTAASADGGLQLASFTRGRVRAVIVTGASRGDCERFARDAEAAL